MKKKMFSAFGRVAMPAVISLGLAGMSSQVMAAPIIGAVGVSTDMGTAGGSTPLPRVIDQSGLSQTYTSGVTDFATYVASTTHVGINNGTASWFSALNHKTGNVVFDLGVETTIDAFALWNLHRSNNNSIQAFKLYDESNNLLGTYSAVRGPGPTSDIITAQVFDFSAITTRYVTLEVDSNWGGALSGFGEAAFRGVTPEPSALALLGLSGLGLLVSRRRKSGQAA